MNELINRLKLLVGFGLFTGICLPKFSLGKIIKVMMLLTPTRSLEGLGLTCNWL